MQELFSLRDCIFSFCEENQERLSNMDLHMQRRLHNKLNYAKPKLNFTIIHSFRCQLVLIFYTTHFHCCHHDKAIGQFHPKFKCHFTYFHGRYLEKCPYIESVVFTVRWCFYTPLALTVWTVKTFFKRSSFTSHRRKKVVRVWNDMRVNK